MHAKRPIVPAGTLPLILCLLLPMPASAQQAVGIVTGLQGRVDLTRQPSPAPVGLRLRDDLFLRDVIDTRQESVVRMLLGGQSTVTVRELTRLEIRAELLPTGGTRTIYDLTDGKIRVNIAPKLMRPGDVIEIHTPNAVATIRGSSLIAEYIAKLGLSRFLLLTGRATITPQGLASFDLAPNLQGAISGTPQTGIQAQPPTLVTPAEAAQAQQGWEIASAQGVEANTEQLGQQHVATATQLATAVVEAATGAPLGPSPATAATPVETGTATPDTKVAPVTPLVSQQPVVGDVPEIEIIDDMRTLGQTLKRFSGTSTRGGVSPVVRIVNSTVTQTGPNSLIEADPGANATLAGPLLQATDSGLSTEQRVLRVENATLTGTGAAPLLQFDTPSAEITELFSAAVTGANFLRVGEGGALTVAGPLLRAANTGFLAGDPELNVFGFLVVLDGGTLTGTGTSPLVQLSESLVGASGSFLAVRRSPSTATRSTVSLAGPLLSATGSLFLTLSGASPDESPCCTFLFVGENGRLEGTGSAPLLHFASSGIITGGSLINVTPSSNQGDATPGPGTMTLAGPLVSASDSLFGIFEGHFVRVRDGSTLISTTAAPLLQFIDSEVHTDFSFFDVRSQGEALGSTVDLAGPVLKATGTIFTTGTDANFFNLRDGTTFTSRTEEPLLELINSQVTALDITEPGLLIGPWFHFIRIGRQQPGDGGSGDAVSATLIGPLFRLTDSSVTAISDLVNIGDRASFRSMTKAPLIQLANASVTAAALEPGHFFRVRSGQLITGGSLLQLSGNSTVSVTDGVYINASSNGLILVPGAALESVGVGNSVTVNNAIVSNATIQGIPVRRTNGAFISLGPNSGLQDVSVEGTSVIAADGPGTLVTIDPVLLSTPAGSVLTIQDRSVNLGFDNLASFSTGDGESVSIVGDRLVVTAFPDQGIAQLNGTVISITDSMVTEAGEIALNGTSLAVPASLLQITNSTLNGASGAVDLLSVGDGSILKTFGSAALIEINRGTLAFGGNFVQVGDSTLPRNVVLSLSAPLLRVADSMLTSGDDFVAVPVSGTLTSTTPEPLIQLTNTPITTLNTGSFNQGSSLVFVTSSDTVNLSGPLLNATNTNPELGLTLGGTIVTAVGGGELTSTSTAPLITLSGGTHRIGTTPLGTHSLFHLSGGPTDPETGLGNTSPLQTGGQLFEATGGAHVYVGGGAPSGNALRLDTALLDASAPIISLIGSAAAQTSLTTGSSTMELIRSNVTSVGPVVALDRGLINVNDGPLINLTQGTSLAVTGDLLSLINGSRINVVNGPLIRVDGFSPTETASRLNVMSGGLVNFGGTGGNMIVVTNAIAPDPVLQSGIPVSTNAGGMITVGPSPIKNPSLGTISVNGATVGVATSFTGSLIQATNGGVVNIAVPAPAQ